MQPDTSAMLQKELIIQNTNNQLHINSGSEKIATPHILFANNCWSKQNQETYTTWPLLYFLCFFKILQYFGVRTFPAQDMKCCYLQKKIEQLFWISKRPYSLIALWLYSLRENTLASIFKWLVAWKKAFQDQNFSLNIFPHHPLYHMPLPKAKKS